VVALPGSVSLFEKKLVSLQAANHAFRSLLFLSAALPDGIYLAHNLSFLERFGAASQIGRIDSRFFFVFISVQGTLAFVLTAFAGRG